MTADGQADNGARYTHCERHKPYIGSMTDKPETDALPQYQLV